MSGADFRTRDSRRFPKGFPQSPMGPRGFREVGQTIDSRLLLQTRADKRGQKRAFEVRQGFLTAIKAERGGSRVLGVPKAA